MAKSTAQLEAEIKAVLARKPARRHHSTVRGPSEDAWDVAMDAILSGDAIRAAQIAHDTGETHRGGAPQRFLKALHAAPVAVRYKFEGQIAVLEGRSGHALPYFYEMVKHASDQLVWFKALEELKKPGYKGLSVVWWVGDRSPKQAKQSTIKRLDIDQGYYKKVRETDLPVEVRQRFDERL